MFVPSHARERGGCELDLVQPHLAPLEGKTREHIAWTQALDLNFPLLSDWNGEAIRGFGIARDYRGMSDIARRSAFLIDGDGTVRAAWAYDDAEVPDFDELISAARDLSAS